MMFRILWHVLDVLTGSLKPLCKMFGSSLWGMEDNNTDDASDTLDRELTRCCLDAQNALERALAVHRELRRRNDRLSERLQQQSQTIVALVEENKRLGDTVTALSDATRLPFSPDDVKEFTDDSTPPLRGFGVGRSVTFPTVSVWDLFSWRFCFCREEVLTQMQKLVGLFRDPLLLVSATPLS